MASGTCGRGDWEEDCWEPPSVLPLFQSLLPLPRSPRPRLRRPTNHHPPTVAREVMRRRRCTTLPRRLTTRRRRRTMPNHGCIFRVRRLTLPHRVATMRRVPITRRVRATTAVRRRIAAAATVTPVARKKAAKIRRPGGRPSNADALRLRDRILEAATQLFLADGYGSTTIEAVALRARISKRTLYHRFDDKAALFSAVVHKIIGQIRPPADVPLIEGATLRDILRRLAGMILHAALAPQAIALHRLVMAESARFPELVRAVHGDGSMREASTLIAGLLARELPASKLTAADRAFAAEQFIFMIVTLPQRRAMGYGTAMAAAELEAWADKSVGLFLNGCHGWSA